MGVISISADELASMKKTRYDSPIESDHKLRDVAKQIVNRISFRYEWEDQLEWQIDYVEHILKEHFDD